MPRLSYFVHVDAQCDAVFTQLSHVLRMALQKPQPFTVTSINQLIKEPNLFEINWLILCTWQVYERHPFQPHQLLDLLVEIEELAVWHGHQTKGPFYKDVSSSNQQFSGDRFNFGNVLFVENMT